jgi:hypothetical protein
MSHHPSYLSYVPLSALISSQNFPSQSCHSAWRIISSSAALIRTAVPVPRNMTDWLVALLCIMLELGLSSPPDGH